MPKEYIEREKLLSKIKYIAKTYNLGEVISSKLQSAIDKTTTANVIEVVRCGKCRFREPVVEGGKIFYVCNHVSTVLVEVEPNEYCSYGERKDGAESDI